MPDRFEKALQDLSKQKEDIELLLNSLEDAYAEAAITEKHYNELRTKNKKKLDEISKKIETVKSRQEKTANREETEEKPKPAKTAKPAKPAEKPKPEKPPEEPSAVAPSADLPEVPMGTPEPSEDMPEVPMGTPEPAEAGSKKITEEDFKSIMTKVFEKAKLVDLAEITPKLEKMTAELEKMKAHIDAIREQKNTETDRTSRINEELGELRSGFHTNEGRLSEIEMKVKDHDITLSDLRPQKYSRSIQNIDRALKMHEGRLDKHDDLTSMIMKRISSIKEVLEQFGSMEQIAKMNKEISKKLISIDDREKRIKRISDKLDGIFSELNKRLDEFIFYKAKQDSVGELVDELLRNIDEMDGRLGKFAEKADLEILRDNLEGRIASAGPMQAGMSAEERNLHNQKEELMNLLSLLEEQHDKKTISDHEYEKAKAENNKRIQELDKKMAALNPAESAAMPAVSGAVPEENPETPAEEPGEEPPAGEAGEKEPEASQETNEEKPEEPQSDETPPETPEDGKYAEPQEPGTGEPRPEDVQEAPVTPEESPETPPEEEPPEEEPEPELADKSTGPMTKSMLKNLESMANIGGGDRAEAIETEEEPEQPPEKQPPEPQEEEPQETAEALDKESSPEPPAEPAEEPSIETPTEPEKEAPEESPESLPDAKPETPESAETLEKPKEPPKAKPVHKKPTMLETLEDSFRKGLITKEAYERTRKVLEKKA